MSGASCAPPAVAEQAGKAGGEQKPGSGLGDAGTERHVVEIEDLVGRLPAPS
jgi:hypothetical protein